MRSAALAILITAWIAAVAAAKETTAAEETVVVTSTRVPSLVGDEPIRIEAVPSEEIEENLTVQPGNIPRIWWNEGTSGHPSMDGLSTSVSAPGWRIVQ